MVGSLQLSSHRIVLVAFCEKDMKSVKLSDEARNFYSKEAETGMGFQELSGAPNLLLPSGRAFVLNSSILVIEDPGSESMEGEEGSRFVPLFRDLESLLAQTEDEQTAAAVDFRMLPGIKAWKPPLLPAKLPSPPPRPGSPGYPPFMHYTRSGEEFYRLSADHGDWRIRPDGSVEPRTYATTPNDLTVTPSGLAAVGRFALPVRLAACYVFQIIPLPGTPIYFGTVVPNYGFCGGGVEVFFPYGCPPGCARLWKTIPLY